MFFFGSRKWEGHNFFRQKILKYPGPPPPPPPNKKRTFPIILWTSVVLPTGEIFFNLFQKLEIYFHLE